MIEHTHDKKQYAVVVGRKCLLYKRPKKKGKKYVSPVPAGVETFRSKAQAEAFKKVYDA
jgi:hypothetical protein